MHLLERGFSVRLLTDTGTSVPGPDGAGGFAGGTESADAVGLLLDTLAVVDHSEEESLSAAYDAVRGGNEGLLIAFFGDLDEEQAAVAGRMRQRSGAAVAFVLDGDAWTRGPGGIRFSAGQVPVAERLRLLRRAGWTALPVAPGDALADLWRAAADRTGAEPQRQAAADAPADAPKTVAGGWS